MKKPEHSYRYRRTAIQFLLISLMCLLSPEFLPAQEDLGEGWFRFPLEGSSLGPLYGASSVLDGDRGMERSPYDVEKARDGKPDTAWVEGVPGPGEGESYWIAFTNLPQAMGFINGYAKNRNLFEKNHRIRSLELQLFAGVNISGFAGQWETYYDARAISSRQEVELADSMKAQRIPLPFPREELQSSMDRFRRSEAVRHSSFPQALEMGITDAANPRRDFLYILRMEIRSTYPGSRWEDSCLAELWPDYGEAQELLLHEDSQGFSIITGAGELVPVHHDHQSILTLVETSPDGQWALILLEPACPEGGRVSSRYGIFHLPTGRDLTGTILGSEEGLLPFGFIEEGGRIYIEVENPGSGETEKRECRFLIPSP